MTPPEGDLPGLDADAVRRWSGLWDDGELWKDIRFLADRFWSAPDSDRVMAWHHLVLAVGNFKRQGGYRLRPQPLGSATSTIATRPDTLDVPGDGEVAVEDPVGWRRLEDALTGAAVATTTTLLSALWPDRHFVFDWRVHAAANALRIHAGLEPTAAVTPDSINAATQTSDHYTVVRTWLLAVAARTGESLANVERALYELSRHVPDDAERSWRDYAEEVARRLVK